jgi:hypothetical protein
MHSTFGLALLITVITSLAPVSPWTDTQSRAAGRSNAEQFDNFRIPAGTALLLTLSTPFDSATAKVDDQIEAALWSPVIQEGVELIPEGSTMSGSVTAVVRASKQTPIGSVAFRLSIVQHASTGDRAMLPTQRFVIEAPVSAADRERAPKKLKPTDATMSAGARFVAVTSEPLIVRIPK